jgi:hypothetical protein
MRLNKRVRACLTLSAALLILASAGTAQIRRQLICGRTIDKQGHPVANARIILADRPSSKRKDSVEELLPGAKADMEGKFCIETFLSPSSTLMNQSLYTTSPLDENVVALVDVPFTRLRRRPANFKGQPIKVGREERTDVGDIPVQVYYGRVLLKINDRAGRPLLITEDKWQPVWLRARDADGFSVYESGLSADEIERAVNLKSSSISLALPEGTWFLEVALDGVPPNTLPDNPKVSWLRVPKRLKVRATGNPIEVALKK